MNKNYYSTRHTINPDKKVLIKICEITTVQSPTSNEFTGSQV